MTASREPVDKRTATRRMAKAIIGVIVKHALDSDAWSMEREAAQIGVSEETLLNEVYRQAEILYKAGSSAGRLADAQPVPAEARGDR